MFSSIGELERRHRNLPLRISVGLHVVALAVMLFYRAAPIFVTPSSLALGNGDKSYRIVYFAPVGEKNQPDADERKELTARSTRLKLNHHKQQERPQQRNVAGHSDPDHKGSNAGSEYGSLFTGDYEGHDVKPAYPIVFPDPPVSRGDFPEGFQGDVIVEVTIDKLGNVVSLRLLQGLGQSIDDKVMATLREWRYKPAMMDGEPIAEKHDVHFHYPG
jgi:TonB family protein